jgi:hypothetical protein
LNASETILGVDDVYFEREGGIRGEKAKNASKECSEITFIYFCIP